jgi:preprotein translocase subunit YajC
MGGNTGLVFLLQLLAIMAIFYFLILRPQQQARKKAAEILATIKKGDEITTAGGVVGKVREVKDNLLVVESGTAQLVIERARVVRVGDTATPGMGS